VFLLLCAILNGADSGGDFVELDNQVRANQPNRDDDDNRNQSGDQTILHGGYATAILGNGGERLSEASGAENQIVHDLTL
jgi:hypothetical protein